jgi:hypothetical protein
VGGQDDLVSSLKAIMAAKREELGGPPTPEELLAYRDGRLGPEERQRIEARIAVHPDAARALADLAAFPAVEPAPGTREPSAEEIGARWLAFRERLPERPEPAPREKDARQEPVAILVRRLPRGGPRWPLAVAALLALAVVGGAGFLVGRRQGMESGSAPAINSTIVELPPVGEGAARSAIPPVEIPQGSEELVLVLRTDEPSRFPDYEVEVRAPDGRMWSRKGLRPTALGTFHLSFPRDSLKAGRYEIQLFGLRQGRRTPLARYALPLAGGPSPP